MCCTFFSWIFLKTWCFACGVHVPRTWACECAGFQSFHKLLFVFSRSDYLQRSTEFCMWGERLNMNGFYINLAVLIIVLHGNQIDGDWKLCWISQFSPKRWYFFNFFRWLRRMTSLSWFTELEDFVSDWQDFQTTAAENTRLCMGRLRFSCCPKLPLIYQKLDRAMENVFYFFNIEWFVSGICPTR